MSARDWRLDRESGFTVLELLISTAIMMAVLAGLFTVLNPAEGTFQAQPEVSDMQQRMRVGVDTLSKEILMAGAGMYSGQANGALLNFFAPLLPYRIGLTSPDPPGTFRTDTISLMYVPETASQTTIANAMPPTSEELKVNQEAGCPPNDQLCGFKEGMALLIFDDTGSYNTFVVTEVQSSACHLQRHGPDFAKAYDAGAYVTQMTSHTYYLRSSDAAGTYQLMHYDGATTEMPVVDNVVGLTFEYFGEPQPPVLRKPVSDPKGPWTTYGPKPPALGVSQGNDYGDGENCVFEVVGGQHASRLPDLAPGSTNLVPLTAAMLTDGPWCPGPATPGRFDADLLRIRQVRARIRVQVSPKMLRGTGALFTKAGHARGGEMWVPDQELRFEVTPRNMNLGR